MSKSRKSNITSFVNSIPEKNIEAEIESIDDTDKKLYQKLSHLEHVLLRPSTYIGSIEKTVEEVFVLDNSDPNDICITKKSIEYIPGLFKIFDEILVNAEDQERRLYLKKEGGDNSVFLVSNIKVDIEQDTGRITIYNDGDGIHIVKVDEHGIYAPELIFGHLLTGTNYDYSV